MDKINIIYIMGGGRSGSTILSILLNNMPDVFFMGELHKWNLYKGKANNDREAVRKFWGDVLLQIKLPEKYFKADYFKYLEYHSSMFYLPCLTKQKLIKEYQEFTSEIIKVIAALSGKKYLVDSSHYPFRALLLNKNKMINLKVLYLYRHPINVVSSFSLQNIEQNSKNPLSANLFLFFVSILSEIVYHRLPANCRMKIRYEDLIEQTETTVERLRLFIGLPNFKIDLNNLGTGYIFQSNRIRQSEKISLGKKIDRPSINLFWKVFTHCMQFPFLLINKRFKKMDIKCQ